MSNGKHCYLHKNAKFPSSLNLMKGGMIESVGWNKDGTSEHTGEILIGTEGGRIYGSALQAGKADVALKRLYCIEGGGRVSGLWWEVHGRMSKRYLIVATTPTRVYTFVGTQSLQNVFESYRTTPEFYEMPLSGPDRDPIGRVTDSSHFLILDYHCGISNSTPIVVERVPRWQKSPTSSRLFLLVYGDWTILWRAP